MKKSTNKLTQSEIHVEWLEKESRDNLRFILAEYRFLVGRFVQWMGLTLGKSSDEQVRQLLLHNLVDECGQIDGKPSHLTLLDSCLASCGVERSKGYAPSQTTRTMEEWFFKVFANQDCHTCLCVLGPGTESISQQFLSPLEGGIRNAFVEENVDYTYFDVHRTEVEAAHAEDINRAIAVVEGRASAIEKDYLLRARSFWCSEAISHYATFWSSLQTGVREKPVVK